MNQLRTLVEERLQERFAAAKELDLSARQQGIDVTRPGFPFALGSAHPIKALLAEIATSPDRSFASPTAAELASIYVQISEMIACDTP